MKKKLDRKEERRERYNRKQFKGKPLKTDKNFKRLKTRQIQELEAQEDMKDVD